MLSPDDASAASWRLTGHDDSFPQPAPIPPQLGRLTMLQELFLDENALTGQIPPDLGQLTNLESLNLGDNTGTTP